MGIIKPIAMSKIIKPIAISTKNKMPITETLLSTNGYKSASVFAPKIVMLLEHCITLLPAESTYDFGFKLLLRIADQAGKVLSEYLQNDKGDIDEENVDVDEDDEDALNSSLKSSSNALSKEREIMLLIHALIVVMFEMLTASDCILFESIFQSAFPKADVDWNKYSKSMGVGGNEFIFESELQHLQSMGFSNTKQCKQMLVKYDGKTDIVMQELFENVKSHY